MGGGRVEGAVDSQRPGAKRMDLVSSLGSNAYLTFKITLNSPGAHRSRPQGAGGLNLGFKVGLEASRSTVCL